MTSRPDDREIDASRQPAWRRAILSRDASIRDAIRNLDEVGIKIVMITTANGVLEGTVSDGDIRRGLLRGLELDQPIASVMHRDAVVVPPEMSRELVLQMMVANKIQQIPVVDDQRRVVDLHLWDALASTPERSNAMVIMAGGKGTRLQPQTHTCPKPLLPVAGKPMIDHIIERAQLDGFRHFYIAVWYLGHMIEEHLGNGERLGIRVEYLREQEPLGTAGALALLPRPEQPFLVTNGDVLTDIHYGELLDFHVRQQAMATMAVRTHEWQHPFGVVQTRGVEITGFEEKPVSRTRINAGVYALEPAALDVLAGAGHCDMPALFERLQARHDRIVAYPVHEPWLDLGHPDDLFRANAERG
jgi:dTDP-glucose pyrophosphorylase